MPKDYSSNNFKQSTINFLSSQHKQQHDNSETGSIKHNKSNPTTGNEVQKKIRKNFENDSEFINNPTMDQEFNDELFVLNEQDMIFIEDVGDSHSINQQKSIIPTRKTRNQRTNEELTIQSSQSIQNLESIETINNLNVLDQNTHQESNLNSNDIVDLIIYHINDLNKGKKVEKKTIIVNIAGFQLIITPTTKKDMMNTFGKEYDKISNQWTKLNRLCGDKVTSGEAMQKFAMILGFPELNMESHNKAGSLLILMRFMNAISRIPLEYAKKYAQETFSESISQSELNNNSVSSFDDIWTRIMMLISPQKRDKILSFLSIHKDKNDTLENISRVVQHALSSGTTQKRKILISDTDSRKKRKISKDEAQIINKVNRIVEERKIQFINWNDKVKILESTQIQLGNKSNSNDLQKKKNLFYLKDNNSSDKSICIQSDFVQGNTISLPISIPGTNESAVRLGFSGGLVNSMDWLPEDENLEELYFSIATYSDKNSTLSKEMLQLASDGSYSPIEIWSARSLDLSMNLIYRIHHKYSFAWSCKWMPQLYNYPKFRYNLISFTEIIGVLACSMNDGSILVFGVPKQSSTTGNTTLDIEIESTPLKFYFNNDEPKVYYSMEWTKDGNNLIAGDCSGGITIFSCNFENSNSRLYPVIQINAHSDLVTSISTSEVNFNYFASASTDGSIRVYNLMNPNEEIFYKKTLSWPNKVCFPAFSDALLVNYEFKGVQQYRADTFGFSNIYNSTLDNPICDISFSPTSSSVAISSSSGSILLFVNCSETGQIVNGKNILSGFLMKSIHDSDSGNYVIEFPNHATFQDLNNTNPFVQTPNYLTKIIYKDGNESKASLVNKNKESKDKDKERNLNFPAIFPDKEGQIRHLLFHPSTKESCQNLILASNHEGIIFFIRIPEIIQTQEPTPY